MNRFLKNLSEFEWAAIKLSVFYVLIALAISVSFSIVIYNISTHELGRGLKRTFGVIDQCAPNKLPPGFENLEHARNQQIKEINDNLQDRLIYFNLIILVISSALSYFLAKKTLHPLEQAMESQKRFTADASHELRTPLAAMRSENEVALRDKNLSIKEAREQIESNIEEIGKLESLSTALLTLARYEQGKIELKSLDISDLIVDAYERVEVLAKAKQIEFINDLKTARVLGDKNSLTELFVILLDNAIKYSPSKSKIQITIKVEGSTVSVHIKDHGFGIKESDLPHIFERFYRADNSRNKTKNDGFGLGLSLAKQIADLNEAQIKVKSTVDKGSEFAIIFPKN